jgi:hypothetical protein
MNTIHPFESSGLGLAPFECTGCTDGGRSCAYCGTGIRWEYHILSSDGKKFIVGCDCVSKTGAKVGNFKEVRRKLILDRRTEKRELSAKIRKQQFDAKNKELAAAWFLENSELSTTMILYEDDNEFMSNLRAQYRKCGYLTVNQTIAAKRYYADQEALRVKKNVANFVGEIGNRVKNVSLKVVFSKIVGVTRFGYREQPIVLTKFETTEGNELVWFTSTVSVIGQEGLASFTPKEHKEYEGLKQTVVSRVAFA